MLSGNRIARMVAEKQLVIDPFNPDQVNPNSYNLRLHSELMLYDNHILDMADDNYAHKVMIQPAGYVLMPGQLYLGRTVEYLESPSLVPLVEGRSSVGRLGCSVHATAGFCDRGFCGHVTLEISVIQPLRIYANVAIAQVCFHEVDDAGPIYAGKYQNTRGSLPQASRLWKELQKQKEQQK